MPDEQLDIRVALARFEGKLDASLMRLDRHEGRLDAHSVKIDDLHRDLAEVKTRQAEQAEANRRKPNWAAVLSVAMSVATVLFVLLQNMYG